MDERIGYVAAVFELRHRIEAAGSAGVAGDKGELAIFNPRVAPAQVIARLDRTIVLVRSEERKIQAVARIVEVVGIAAELSNRLLGRKDQPYIGVFLVLIEIVTAAGIKRDYIATIPGIG